jgi:hypothetical protein
MYKKVDSLWSDLRPGGARPVDEGNAADQSGLSANAVLICSIPLIHRGLPRQVARHHNHEAAGRRNVSVPP